MSSIPEELSLVAPLPARVTAAATRAPAGATTVVRQALLVLLLLFGASLSIAALASGLRQRVPLAILLGPRFWIWISGVALSLALACAALAQLCARWRRGERETTWSSVRAWFCCLVLAWITFVLFLQPMQRVYLLLHAGLVAGVFALWLLLVPRLRARLASRLAHALDLCTFTLCCTLAGGELSLALLARCSSSPWFAQPRTSAGHFIEVNRFAPGLLHLGFPTNAQGYYDEPFGPLRPGEQRIASIADSFGASTVPHRYHFTTVVEELLPSTRVDNIAVAGIGPPEYLYLVANAALPLAPDLIVVNLFMGNDIAFLVSGEKHDHSALRAWFDQSHVYLLSVPRRALRLARERRDAQLSHDLPPPASATDAQLDSEDPATLERAYPWIVDPLLEPPTFSSSAFLENQSSHVRQVCAGDEAYPAFFAQLQAIAEAAGATPLLFTLIPDEFQVEDALWEQIAPRLVGLPLERDKPQRLTGAWLSEHKLDFIDLLPRMRAAEPLADGNRHLYLLRDTHFNVRGNRLAGEALAEAARALLGQR